MADRASEVKRLIERRCGTLPIQEQEVGPYDLAEEMQKVGRITRVLSYCEPYELDHIMEYLGPLIHAIENPES